MPTTSSVQGPPGAGTPTIANAELHMPRQLFADEAGIAGAKANPGIFGRLQQRPVVAVGGVIGETENFDRRPIDLGIGPAARQDGLDFGALLEPRPDGGGLRRRQMR